MYNAEVLLERRENTSNLMTNNGYVQLLFAMDMRFPIGDFEKSEHVSADKRLLS
jgi:hypothetical protein